MLTEIRRNILLGAPVDVGTPGRALVWQLLLGAQVDAERYVELVERGPSRAAAAIEKDLRRTLAGERSGGTEVPSPADRLAAAEAAASRTRLLNAFVHAADDELAAMGAAAVAEAGARQPAAVAVFRRGYHQGFGSLAAVLLAAMSEVEAFAS